jgi:hypothetical protein
LTTTSTNARDGIDPEQEDRSLADAIGNGCATRDASAATSLAYEVGIVSIAFITR